MIALDAVAVAPFAIRWITRFSSKSATRILCYSKLSKSRQTHILACDPEIAYHPSKSNYTQARHNSIRLGKKLLKNNLLQSFDSQLNSDIEAGFCEILKGEQVAEILSRTHCCSTVNFMLKPASDLTPLRIMTNALSIMWASHLTRIACPGSQSSHKSSTSSLSSLSAHL